MILILLVIILLLAYVKYRSVQKSYKGIEGLPGPLSLPLLGNSLSFGYNLVEIFKKINSFHENYGGVVRIWPIYLSPIIMTNDADIIGALLNSTKWINKARDYRFFEPWLGKGLLISTGEKWHKRRKLITPAFHFQVLEQFMETFAKEADTLADKLDECVGQSSVDVYPILNKCALDIICKTAMGTDIKTQSGENMKYLRAVKEMLRIIGEREFSIIKTFETTFKFTLDYLKMKKVVSILHDFTHSVIIKRRDTLIQQQKGMFSGSDRKRKTAFLDLLISAVEDGMPLTDQDIQEEVDTFLFEGFDTVTSAISFTLYEISRHPEVQEQIVDELKSVFGEYFEEPFTMDRIHRLKYVGQVIKEGLRLYPSVPIFERELQETFEIGTYSFPKKTTIIVNSYNLHRQEVHFSDPEQFKPERFEDDLTGKHPFCYIPFSGGPRNCIGLKFAMNEMKVVIAKLLMRLRLFPTVPEHELILFTDGILKSKNGMCMRIRRRT